MTIPNALSSWLRPVAGLSPPGKRLAFDSPPCCLPLAGERLAIGELLATPCTGAAMGPRRLGQALQGQGCPPRRPAVSCTSQYLMGKQGRQKDQELDGLYFFWLDISSKRGPLPLLHTLSTSFPRRASEVRACLSLGKPWSQPNLSEPCLPAAR